MTAITTHVLDTVRGRPAAGVAVVLEYQAEDGGWIAIGGTETEADGRARDLVPEKTELAAGTYRLVFHTGRYFESRGFDAFYPQVVILFDVAAEERHYHVPLLLSPYGYSTYRGS
jgi:5-hydroxyisourate hydrolase